MSRAAATAVLARHRPFLNAAALTLRRRLGQAVMTAVLVTVLSFLIVQNLPGDIAFRIAAGRYGYDRVSGASADAVRSELGLDRPAWLQLGDWLGQLLRLDLGTSLVTGGRVADELAHHLSSSLLLAAAALLPAFLGGAALGAVAALRPGGLADRFAGLWVVSTRAMPPFLLGLVLILVFSVHLGLLPAAGHGGATSIVLPAATLAVGLSGLFARVTRDAVVEVRRTEYVRFAETKGLSERRVVQRHVARNVSVTLVAYLGVQAVILVEGVVVVESLFGWPGLGHALVHAVFWRDVPVIQATAIVLGLVVVTVNAVADVVVLAVDPRPRAGAR